MMNTIILCGIAILLCIYCLYGAYTLAVSGKPIGKGKGVYVLPLLTVLAFGVVLYFR